MATSSGITRDKIDQIKQRTYLGEERLSALLQMSGDTDTQVFSCPASFISYQADGTLQATVSVSCNGVNFSAATPIASGNAIYNYNTSLVKQVKVTWTSGSGRVVILAR